MTEVLITSSVLIAVVLLVRRLFRGKVRHTLIYGLWLPVALRLLIPINPVRLELSILNLAQPLTDSVVQTVDKPISGPTQEEVYRDILVDHIRNDPSVFLPEIQEEIRSEQTLRPEEMLDKLRQDHPQQELLTPQAQQQALQQAAGSVRSPTVAQLLTVIWIVGCIVMALWFISVNLLHQRKLRRSRQAFPVAQNTVPVFVSEEVQSPCLVGLLRPKVYLTPHSIEDPRRLNHILTHELTHLRHRDHLWSWLRCACLCVYWFNPLLWLAAGCSRRDCELACDEDTLRQLGDGERIAYGKTLLETVAATAPAGQLLCTATSMVESKAQLRERIGLIVHKPKRFTSAAVCLALVWFLTVGCTFTGPVLRSLPSGESPSAPTLPQESVTVFLRSTQAHYSADGLLIGQTEYTYDSSGRLTGKSYRGTADDFADQYYSYTYDEHGSLVREEYRAPQQNVAYVLQYSYTYRDDGTVAAYTDHSTQAEYFLDYDDAGRLRSITCRDEQGQLREVVACVYSADGHVTELTDLRGADPQQYFFAYDEIGRLLSLRYVTGGADSRTAAQWTWSYPSASIVCLHAPHRSAAFYYDRGRLIAAENSGFVPDSAGNIIEAADADGSGCREVYTYQTIELPLQQAAKLPADNEQTRLCPAVAYLDHILGFVLPRPIQ